MPNILHRLMIDAPPARVHELVANREGIEQWWTGKPVAGDDEVGGRLSVHFVDPTDPAASFEVVERSPERVVWRTVEGPSDWIDTRISSRSRRATTAARRCSSATRTGGKRASS